MIYLFDREEKLQNIAGKGENAAYQHFLCFPQCFPKDFSQVRKNPALFGKWLICHMHV